MSINYHGRLFKVVRTSPNAETDADTRMFYSQNGDIVWATIQGGRIRFGTLVAKVDQYGSLEMRYQHVNEAGELRTGVGVTAPEQLPDGRLRLHEHWQWTSGDFSNGEAILEEVS
jgi:hypothetical protein